MSIYTKFFKHVLAVNFSILHTNNDFHKIPFPRYHTIEIKRITCYYFWNDYIRIIVGILEHLVLNMCRIYTTLNNVKSEKSFTTKF